jgi:hypothetical protein
MLGLRDSDTHNPGCYKRQRVVGIHTGSADEAGWEVTYDICNLLTHPCW